MTAIINADQSDKLARLCGELGIELKNDEARAVYATAYLRVFNERDRGGT